MNNRIKELAEQAITEKLSLDDFVDAIQKEPHDFYAFRISELDKFAELIIQECANIALTSGRVCNKSELAIAEADRIYDKIHSHFSIDEDEQEIA